MLYKYNTLNKEYFKSGRYVEFETYPTEVTTYISKYIKGDSGLIYYPKFYKVKLLHQLNNGYLDLTKDVWTKFTNVTRSSEYWFSNPNFIYYCPSQYKGRLVSSLEIEDLYKFSLYGIPDIDRNENSSFKFSINITGISQDPTKIHNGIEITPETISIKRVRLEYWFDDPTNPQTIYGDIGVNNPEYPVPLELREYNSYLAVDNIDEAKINTIINYRITPVLSTVGGSSLYEGTTKNGVAKDLPDEFINKYTITGSMRLSTQYDNVVFKKVATNFSCDLVRGVKIYNEYILTNKNGLPLDENLELSEVPYIFLREGTAIKTPNAIIINSYTVINKKPNLIFPAVTEFNEFILELFKITEVEESSIDCVPVTYQTLNINFNINMSPLTVVKMYQDGDLIYSLTNVSLPGVYALIASNKSTTIQVTRPGYKNISEVLSPISQETTITLAFIANVGISSNIDTYKLSWKGQGENLPTFSSNIPYMLHTNTLPEYSTNLFSVSTQLRETPAFDVTTYGSLINATLAQDVSIVDVPGGTYFNVISGQCATYQGTIFNKTINW